MTEKTRNKLLYNKVLAAIREVWVDRSVDMQQVADDLRALQGEIEEFITATESEIERQEGLVP